MFSREFQMKRSIIVFLVSIVIFLNYSCKDNKEEYAGDRDDKTDNIIEDYIEEMEEDEDDKEYVGDKYDELRHIIEGYMKEKEDDYKIFYPEYDFYWEYLDHGLFPNCDGKRVRVKKINGLFLPAGKVTEAIKIINNETYKEDDYIIAQICVVTWIQKSLGPEKNPIKHYRAYECEYDLTSKEWEFSEVKKYVKVWYEKVNRFFLGNKVEMDERRGCCLDDDIEEEDSIYDFFMKNN